MSREESSTRKEQKQQTRKKILDAATALFMQASFHEISTDKVAEMAGVSKGTIFHHFENKDILIKNVVEHAFMGYVDDLNEQLAQEDITKDHIKEVTKLFFHQAMEHPGFIKLILDFSTTYLPNLLNSERPPHDTNRFLVQELFQPVIEVMDDILLRFGVPQDSIRKRSHIFLSTLDGIGLYLFMDVIPNDVEYVDQLIDELIDMMIP